MYNFITQLADPNLDKHHSLINLLIIIALPALIALIILFVLMFRAQGKKNLLKLYMAAVLILSVLLPFVAVTFSSIYLNLYSQIPLFFIMYLFFLLIYLICMREQYVKLRCADLNVYKKNTYLDGSSVDEKIVKKNRFSLSASILFCMHISAILFLILSFLEHVYSLNIGALANILLVLGLLLFFAVIRYLIKCPNCNNTIYGFESKRGSNRFFSYNIALYWSIMMRILRYSCFTCMYCHAHFMLGSKDKIKDKGLIITNKHEPNFTVTKPHA